MNPCPIHRPAGPRQQRGVSLLVVLVLLTVMLLGGLTMARVDADASLIAGNTAWRDAALQASEVGLADGFAQLASLASVEADQPGAGYFATRRVDDAAGVPGGFDWADMPSTRVGPYTVRRVIERLCSGPLPIVDPKRQCVVRAGANTLENSAKAGADSFDGPLGTQFRVTVNVIGPKNTQVIVQDAVAR